MCVWDVHGDDCGLPVAGACLALHSVCPHWVSPIERPASWEVLHQDSQPEEKTRPQPKLRKNTQRTIIRLLFKYGYACVSHSSTFAIRDICLCGYPHSEPPWISGQLCKNGGSQSLTCLNRAYMYWLYPYRLHYLRDMTGRIIRC